MKKDYVKGAIAAVLFLIGTNLILELRSFTSLFMGALLVGITGPYLYYIWAKLRTGYGSRSDEDILKQARFEAGLDEEKKDGKE